MSPPEDIQPFNQRAEVGIGPAYGPLAIARTIALACGVERWHLNMRQGLWTGC